MIVPPLRLSPSQDENLYYPLLTFWSLPERRDAIWLYKMQAVKYQNDILHSLSFEQMQ